MHEANPDGSIAVTLREDLVERLIYGMDVPQFEQEDERREYQQTCALREQQLYALMRSLVGDLNQACKGRSVGFRISDEGNGLRFEYSPMR